MGGNPKPPAGEIVHTWVTDAWKGVSITNVKNSVASAGFDPDYLKWHISKHDVYVEWFWATWINTGEVEQRVEDFEAIDQDDDANQVDEE